MFYLKAKKVDISSGSRKYIVVNSKTAIDEGIESGTKLEIISPKNQEKIAVVTDVTENMLSHHEVGINPVTWEKLDVKDGDLVGLDILSRPKSLIALRRKLLNNRLSYKEVKSILDDIVSGRLGSVEAAYFAGCGFNPGFNDLELYYLTKAMAYSGDTLTWPYEKVIDKHSIGGLAGKGITPIIVSIISSKGLVVPNTSTRSITSPAGTTDVMEVFCDMEFTKEEIEALIKKNNACMVWGGGLDLAPADEALIEVEKPLGIELYDKFIVSILAKKVAMGLTHYVLDLPCGPDTKVQDPEDVQIIRDKFEELSAKFGIKVKVNSRLALGPDGRGVGPNLEARDLLKVLRQDKDRFIPLEDVSLTLAGDLLELAEEAEVGKGYQVAEKELRSGKAYEKFKKIIKAQNGNPDVKPEDIPLGEIVYDYKATTSGMIKDIENSVVKEVSHALGTPNIKKAGIYLHKQIGEKFDKDETLFTLYSVSDSRLDMALKILELRKMIID